MVLAARFLVLVMVGAADPAAAGGPDAVAVCFNSKCYFAL